MMGINLILLVILPLAWSYGAPNSRGGGAFAYVDSSGNRYGGTYGLKDGKVVSSTGDDYPVPFADFDYPVPFADNVYQGDDFGASYFANLENLLQEAFKSSIANQRAAFNAARKAFDLTSNQAAGFYPNPNIASRFPAFNNFPPAGFPFTMPNAVPNFGNSAFASAAAGPGYNHQIAAIYPENAGNPNVDKVNHYSDSAVPNNGGFYSVSSKSFSSSANVNGKEINNRGAETVVNDNGKVTHYKVEN